MRILILAVLFAATPALANDVFHRSYESGVQVYRGVPAQPDYAALDRIRQAKAATAERERQAAFGRKQLKLAKRQAEALETIAENLESAARPRATYPAPYSAGVFFDGPYSRFPIIQPRPFVGPRHKRGMRGPR